MPAKKKSTKKKSVPKKQTVAKKIEPTAEEPTPDEEIITGADPGDPEPPTETPEPPTETPEPPTELKEQVETVTLIHSENLRRNLKMSVSNGIEFNNGKARVTLEEAQSLVDKNPVIFSIER